MKWISFFAVILEGIVVPASLAISGSSNIIRASKSLAAFDLFNFHFETLVTSHYFHLIFGIALGSISIAYAIILVVNVWRHGRRFRGFDTLSQFLFPLIAQLWIFLPLSYAVWPEVYFEIYWSHFSSALASVVTTTVGLVLIVMGLQKLGPRFRIVALRTVKIRQGVYHYLDHPIYIGQVLCVFGNFLLFPCHFNALLVVSLAIIQTIRAKLEKELLIV
jgi:protein-S-isoprenylcysteine O-methyltransferase Ste14